MPWALTGYCHGLREEEHSIRSRYQLYAYDEAGYGATTLLSDLDPKLLPDQGSAVVANQRHFSAVSLIGICGVPAHVILFLTCWEIYFYCFSSHPRNISRMNRSLISVSYLLRYELIDVAHKNIFDARRAFHLQHSVALALRRAPTFLPQKTESDGSKEQDRSHELGYRKGFPFRAYSVNAITFQNSKDRP